MSSRSKALRMKQPFLHAVFPGLFKAEAENHRNGQEIEEERPDFLHYIAKTGAPHEDIPDEMELPGQGKEMGQHLGPVGNENQGAVCPPRMKPPGMKRIMRLEATPGLAAVQPKRMLIMPTPQM